MLWVLPSTASMRGGKPRPVASQIATEQPQPATRNPKAEKARIAATWAEAAAKVQAEGHGAPRILDMAPTASVPPERGEILRRQ